jgi:hypothetical protein
MNFVADASIYSTSGRTAPLVALTGRVVVNGIDHTLCELSLPAGGAVATVDREFVANLTLRDSRGLAAGDDINWNDSASGSASDGVTNVMSFGGTVEIEAFLARSSGQRVCGALVKATSQPGRLRVVLFEFVRMHIFNFFFFAQCFGFVCAVVCSDAIIVGIVTADALCQCQWSGDFTRCADDCSASIEC